jgi:hypothetical protein
MLALLIDENLNHRLLRSVPHLDYSLASASGLKGAVDPAVLDFAAKEIASSPLTTCERFPSTPTNV